TVMVRTTAEEFNAALRASADQIDDDRVTRRLARMGLAPDRIDAFKRAHPGPPHSQLGQALTDSIFRAPAVRFADSRSDAEAATWLYDFRWRSPAMDGIGAAHCLDIPFAFDVLDADGTAPVLGTDP